MGGADAPALVVPPGHVRIRPGGQTQDLSPQTRPSRSLDFTTFSRALHHGGTPRRVAADNVCPRPRSEGVAAMRRLRKASGIIVLLVTTTAALAGQAAAAR